MAPQTTKVGMVRPRFVGRRDKRQRYAISIIRQSHSRQGSMNQGESKAAHMARPRFRCFESSKLVKDRCGGR